MIDKHPPDGKINSWAFYRYYYGEVAFTELPYVSIQKVEPGIYKKCQQPSLLPQHLTKLICLKG